MPLAEMSLGALLAETILALMGVVAGLLFVREAQRGGTLPGCGPRSGCEVVASSRWAKVGSLPVAALGLWMYGGLTVATLGRLLGMVSLWASALQVAVVTLAVGGAVWFTFLQLVVLRRVCKFCMFFHTIGVGMGLLVWWEQAAVNWWAIGAGVAALAAMILHQLVFPAKTYAVIGLQALPAEIPSGGALPGGVSSSVSGESTVAFLGGRVRLDMGAWPRLGSPQARHQVAFLFDVTCEECRAGFSLLQQAVASRPDEIAALLVPVPLDPACNPLIASLAGGKALPPSESCDLTRLLLAVWHTDPQAFEGFAMWLMSSRHPPAVQVARSRAHQRLGAAFSTTLLSVPLDDDIQRCISCHQAAGMQKLPLLLLADRLIVGRLGSTGELWQLLEQPAPPAAEATQAT